MLTVYDIRCVDERLTYVRVFYVWGLGVSPTCPAITLALQSDPQVYDYATNCWSLALFNKITLHIVMMGLPVTIICFEI